MLKSRVVFTVNWINDCFVNNANTSHQFLCSNNFKQTNERAAFIHNNFDYF